MAGFGGSIKLKGESAYQKALREIQDSLTVVSSELKVVNSMYDKNDTSTAKLTAQNEVLNKRLVEQRKALQEAKKMLEEARASKDADRTTIMKWETEVNKARSAVITTTREIDKNNKIIEQNRQNLDEANKEVQEFANNEEKAGQGAVKFGDLLKANILSDAIVGGFKALGGVIADMARQFFDFVKGGVENASNLQEVENVVNTVFTNSADKVNDFAKQAGVAYGMTELSAKKFAGTMGAMLDSMGISEQQTTDMSLSLVGLAGDMASFYNLEHQEVWDKIRSGISGETEPLKQLGINMSVANLEAYALSQGIETAYKEMTQAEQATLRYNYLMEVTANAQGDFAKTSDGFANQQKILSLQFENLATSIGTFLLPNLNEALVVFNDMMSGEISLEQGIGQLTQIVVDLATSIVEKLPELTSAGIVMLDTIINGITSALPNLLPAVTGLVTSLLGFLVESLPMIVDAGVQILLSLVQGIGDSLPTLVPTIIDAVLTIVDNLIGNIDLIIDAGIALVVGLAEGLINAIPVLVEKIPIIIENLLSALYRNQAKLLSAGIQLVVQLGVGLVRAIPDLLFAIPKILKSLYDGFTKGVSDMWDIGGNLIKGLINGIKNFDFLGEVKSIADRLVGNFKSFFGIHSPSTLFENEIGNNLALGVGNGFEKTMKNVNSEMANAINTDYSFDISSNATATGGGTSHDALVSAFAEALKSVKIVLNEEVAGEFVTDTITRVVYN